MQNSDQVVLVDVFEQLVQVVRRTSVAGGLSLTAVVTLSHICTEGPQRLTDLSTHEGVSQPSMTQLVSRLERDGLARRTESSSDGRVVLVEATETGRALLARRRAERAAGLSHLFGQLSAKDQSLIDRALPALQRLALLALPPTGNQPVPASAGRRAVRPESDVVRHR